ncbi:MAG: hypothetical protein RR877_09580 [Aurantimicrobium sp.]|uniref:hypothetical protein n=1 Tax=Aurantimicrobium sp. TaxID=1930784 RepID=UPI002FC5E579
MIFTAEQYAVFQNCSIPAAVRAMAALKTSFTAGHIGKQTRPWFVVDFPSLHPADATLVGFEIETGFQTVEAQSNFLNWMWDNTSYTTVDREGCSRCPTEITFPPMQLSLLTSDASPIKAMLDYNETLPAAGRLQTTRITPSNDNGGCVGCHTNISTAAYRGLASNEQRVQVANHIALFFRNLNTAQRYAIQGRSPYTSEVACNRGGTGDGANRIEFKMFHTTTDQEQFSNYLKVSKRLAELIDAQCASPTRSIITDPLRTFAFLTQDLEDGSVIRRGNQQYTASIVDAAAAAGRAAAAQWQGQLAAAA